MTKKNVAKVMLVTGTSSGIGKLLVQNYAKKNYQIIGCSRNDLNLKLKNYKHYSLNVNDERKVKELFTEIRKKHGRLDCLINNAGIASMNHSLLTSMETARKILNTNIGATFMFSREAAKLMSKNKCGRIVNFSTIAVPLELEGEAIYAASKAAVNTLTKVLAKEFSSFGITVNALGPTPVKTNLIKSISKDKIDNLIDKQAVKRYGQIGDIINVVDFFLKPKSDFITGQIIYLGGI